MSKVHFRLTPGHYACGVQGRWGSQVITSSDQKMGVTCEHCRATEVYRGATQRIPNVPRPGYHG